MVGSFAVDPAELPCTRSEIIRFEAPRAACCADRKRFSWAAPAVRGPH
jgi:hypothetical protein